jgi:hypothetical protein
MQFWQALVVAAIPSVAALITAWVAFRDLGMRRRLETSKQFLVLFSTAHGRPADGREHVGLGEQIATVQLIADFARKERLVENAARAGLAELAAWDRPQEIEPNRLRIELAKRVSPADLERVMKEAVGITVARTYGEKRIAAAAQKALKSWS